VERKNSLLTGRNLLQNKEGRPSASTSWGLRGQKRGDNSTITPGQIPAEREKHKLMTTMMCTWRVKRAEGGEVHHGSSSSSLGLCNITIGCFRVT